MCNCFFFNSLPNETIFQQEIPQVAGQPEPQHVANPIVLYDQQLEAMITVPYPYIRNILSSPPGAAEAALAAVATPPPLETNNEKVTGDKQMTNNEREMGMKADEEIIVGAEEIVVTADEIVDENMMEIVTQTVDLTGEDDEELERRMDSLFGNKEPLFKENNVSIAIFHKSNMQIICF